MILVRRPVPSYLQADLQSVDQRGNGFCQVYQLGSPTVQRGAQLLMLALKDAQLMLSPAPAQQLWGLDRD